MDKSIDKILLVDDNKATNFFNKHVLKQWGFKGKIITATNGSEALECIKSSNNIPNLILLDINMPVMCGISFLKKIEPSLKLASTLIMVMMEVDLNKEKLDLIKSYPYVEILKQKMLTHETIETIFSIFQKKKKSNAIA